MQAEHRDLLRRLEHYDFDWQGQSGSFVQRLARENGWTLEYAERACEEYKRFVFLTLTAGHPCTPSDQIDQVWHLHLLDTRGYWEDFCRSVLRQPLHHEPTRGGVQEAAKFCNWYGNTLESYRAAFAAGAPSDLWPPCTQRFATRYVRFERNSVWSKPRCFQPRVTRSYDAWSTLRWLVLTASCLGAAGCAWLHQAVPFSFVGLEFLSFLALLWFASLGVCELLRRRSDHTRASTTACDPYEDALLLGGPKLLADAIIAALVHRDLLHLDSAGQWLAAKHAPSPDLSTLEYAAVRLCAPAQGGATLRQVRRALEGRAAELAPRLQERGLWFAPDRLRFCLLLALIAPMFGVIKLAIGIANHEPVGILMLACALAVLVAVWRYGRQPQLTTVGKRHRASLLEQARELRHRPLGARAGETVLPPHELAAVLFGAHVFSGTAAAEPQRKPDSGSACGAAYGQSDGSNSGNDGGGSSSDGGGSGCGGGGCGGGS